MQQSIRLSWLDYFLGQGDLAGYRQELSHFATSLTRGDIRQTNHAITSQVFGRLIDLGDIAQSRAFYEKAFLRIRQLHGRNPSNDPRIQHYSAFIEALEGKAESAEPSLAAWISPSADGTPWLRWEIGATLPTRDERRSNAPMAFGHPTLSIPDGAYDLVIEIMGPGKDEVHDSFTIPTVSARDGRQIHAPFEGRLFRASLRPREGVDLPGATLDPQPFSLQPNLLANADARINQTTTSASPLNTPGWSMPIPPLTHAGGPSVNGRVTRFVSTQSNSSERSIRSAPIPIDPQNTYLVSAWARVLPDEGGQIGVEFLDADGRTLSQNLSFGVGNHELRWQRIALVLSRDTRSGLSRRHHIPDGAVAMRVLISGNPGIHLSELAVQALAPNPPSKP